MSRGKMSKGIAHLVRSASLVAVVATLAFAPAALAQSSAVDGYGGKGGEVTGALGNGGGGEPGAGASASGSGAGGGGGVLPFTGLDLGFLIGGGLLLVAVGAGLTRMRPHGRTS